MSLAVTFVSIIACAAAGAATTFLTLEQREARHFAASKAEELYTLIEAFDQGLVVFFNNSCSSGSEGCPYKPADSGLGELMRDSAKARMLISFYFPTLWPKVRRADAAVAAGVAALRRYQADPRGDRAELRLEPALADLRDAMDELKHAVVTLHRDGPAQRLRRRLLGPTRAAMAAA